MDAELRRQYNQGYYKNHREEILAQKKEYHKANRDARLAYGKEYHKTNTEKIRRYKKDWDKSHPGYHSKYCSERMKLDPEFHKLINIRNSIRMALKRQGSKKNSKTATLLGAEVSDFLLHIEKLFWPGMSWKNPQKWELDHIRPCSDFDLSDPEQQKICFHFSNWQPLWADDNGMKLDRLDWTPHESRHSLPERLKPATFIMEGF